MLGTGLKIGVALLEHNLKKLNDEIIDSAVEKWEQFDTKYNKNFERYFNKSYKDLNKMRTTLSSDVLKLTDLFQETVLYEKSSDDYNEIYNKVTPELFLEYVRNKKTVWITGHGGIGKSTLMKHTMLTILTDEKKSQNKIPVYIELRKYNYEDDTRRKLIDFIYEEMRLSKFDLDMEMFEYMVDKGRFLFLFDAFDEIASGKSQIFLQEFEDFLKKYDENHIIISSRHIPNGSLEKFYDLHELKTRGLSKVEAVGLIKKVSYDEEVKTKFLYSLSEELYEDYDTLACNPTLLLLMLSLFRTSTKFPKEKSTFLLKSFEELFDRHDARKIAFTRDFKCEDINNYQMMTIFSYFCYKTYSDTNGEQDAFSEEYVKSQLEKAINKYEFLDEKKITVEKILYDFRVCLCIMYKEGEKYYFVHNIFQEFFSAYYIYTLNPNQQKSFIKKYLFSESNKKIYNSRLLNTTFDYLIELDSSGKQTSIKFNFIIPILELIEQKSEFTNYHKEMPDIECFFSHEKGTYKLSLEIDFSYLSEGNYYNTLVKLYLADSNIQGILRSESRKLNEDELQLFIESERFKMFAPNKDIFDGKLTKINTKEEMKGNYSFTYPISYEEIYNDKNLVTLRELYEESEMFNTNEELASLLNKLKIEESRIIEEEDDDI